MTGCGELRAGLNNEAAAESDCDELLLVSTFVRGGIGGRGPGPAAEKDPIGAEVGETVAAAVVVGEVVEVKAVVPEVAETVTAELAATVVEVMVVVMGGRGDEALSMLSPFSWNLLLLSVLTMVCTGGVLLCLGMTTGFGLVHS